jgi:hypothetical protein
VTGRPVVAMNPDRAIVYHRKVVGAVASGGSRIGVVKSTQSTEVAGSTPENSIALA